MPRGTSYFRAIFNRRRCVIFATLFLVQGSARTGFTSSPSIVELSYVAPNNCPNHAAVIERTTALARHSPQHPVFAKAVITRDAGQYRLELDVDGGKQRLLSDSCDALVQTLSVILALAIAPHTTQTPAVPTTTHLQEPISPSTQPPATASPSTENTITISPTVPLKKPVVAATKPKTSEILLPPANPPSKNPSPAPLTTSLGTQAQSPKTHPVDIPAKLKLHPTLGFLTEYGMLPKVGIGPSFGLWVDYGEFSFVTTAKWLLPEWAQMSGTDQHQGGYISFLGGQGGVCVAHGRAQSLRSCVGVEVGDLMGKGSGLTKSQLGHGLWLGGSLEETLRLNLASEMSAHLTVGLVVPVKRPAFGFDGYAWRFEPNPWSFRLGMGFLWF